jgi:phage tail sheath protein FI
MASLITPPKTPGVYISEPDSFPPSIVGVDTAVPAFIGYTEKAIHKSKSVLNTPVQIGSMAEYSKIFGGGLPLSYYLTTAAPKASDAAVGSVSLDGGLTTYTLAEMGEARFNLYNSLRLFYANGGGACYVVSCGAYFNGAATPVATPIAYADLKNGLDAVANLVGPTMLVIPDAVLLDQNQAGASPPVHSDYNDTIIAMLQQCSKKQDRVAIIDVWMDRTQPASAFDPQTVIHTTSAFRNGLSGAEPTALRYGMAYFPNVVTSVVQASDVGVQNLDTSSANLATLVTALTNAASAAYPPTAGAADPRATTIITTYIPALGKTVADGTPRSGPQPWPMTNTELTDAFIATIPAFQQLIDLITASQNVLPPSGAMAGLYTENDAARGVWNAPANVGINQVVAPFILINDDQQADMNVPVEGLAFNAIRSFVNRGTLVWGARTLDSNSNDWRYIQVRRAMIYVEQSVKQALNQMVFAPNDAQTWVTVTSMIETFLHGMWSAGGLMGAAPAQAYNVQCGLGSTMTGDDILNGIMVVQVVLQMIHPAEFIELTFKQEMQGVA